MKCYCLCVLRWLMRPILTLNYLLQIEQERSEEESSVGDALPLAFRCTCFCSASLILFASYSPALLLMRLRHFARSCAICSHDSVGMLKSLREALRCIASGILVTWPAHLNYANFRRVCTSASLSFSGLLCLESCRLPLDLRQLVWKLFSLLACR